MKKMAFFDLTHCLGDEMEHLASEMNLSREYNKVRDEMNIHLIEKYMNYISGKSEDEILNIIGKAEPYKGSVEFIKKLKEKKYYCIIVTDNTFLSSPKINEAFKKKFGVDKIISTSVPEMNEENKYSGKIISYVEKEKIIQSIIKNEKPDKVIGIFQGKNDISSAKKIKEFGGIVYAVNSNSDELKKLSDIWAKDMESLYKEISKIFT